MFDISIGLQRSRCAQTSRVLTVGHVKTPWVVSSVTVHGVAMPDQLVNRVRNCLFSSCSCVCLINQKPYHYSYVHWRTFCGSMYSNHCALKRIFGN